MLILLCMSHCSGTSSVSPRVCTMTCHSASAAPIQTAEPPCFLWNQKWCQDPLLGNRLRICFLFEMTLVSLLTEQTARTILPSSSVLQKSVPGGRTQRQMRRFDANGIEQALEEALQEDPPPSMRQVAKRLG